MNVANASVRALRELAARAQQILEAARAQETARSAEVTVVTAVQDNAGTNQYKDRRLVFRNGLLVAINPESDWTDFP